MSVLRKTALAALFVSMPALADMRDDIVNKAITRDSIGAAKTVFAETVKTLKDAFAVADIRGVDLKEETLYEAFDRETPGYLQAARADLRQRLNEYSDAEAKALDDLMKDPRFVPLQNASIEFVSHTMSLLNVGTLMQSAVNHKRLPEHSESDSSDSVTRLADDYMDHALPENQLEDLCSTVAKDYKTGVIRRWLKGGYLKKRSPAKYCAKYLQTRFRRGIVEHFTKEQLEYAKTLRTVPELLRLRGDQKKAMKAMNTDPVMEEWKKAIKSGHPMLRF